MYLFIDIYTIFVYMYNVFLIVFENHCLTTEGQWNKCQANENLVGMSWMSWMCVSCLHLDVYFWLGIHMDIYKGSGHQQSWIINVFIILNLYEIFVAVSYNNHTTNLFSVFFSNFDDQEPLNYFVWNDKFVEFDLDFLFLTIIFFLWDIQGIKLFLVT